MLGMRLDIYKEVQREDSHENSHWRDTLCLWLPRLLVQEQAIAKYEDTQDKAQE